MTTTPSRRAQAETQVIDYGNAAEFFASECVMVDTIGPCRRIIFATERAVICGESKGRRIREVNLSVVLPAEVCGVLVALLTGAKIDGDDTDHDLAAALTVTAAVN